MMSNPLTHRQVLRIRWSQTDLWRNYEGIWQLSSAEWGKHWSNGCPLLSELDLSQWEFQYEKGISPSRFQSKVRRWYPHCSLIWKSMMWSNSGIPTHWSSSWSIAEEHTCKMIALTCSEDQIQPRLLRRWPSCKNTMLKLPSLWLEKCQRESGYCWASPQRRSSNREPYCRIISCQNWAWIMLKRSWIPKCSKKRQVCRPSTRPSVWSHQ